MGRGPALGTADVKCKGPAPKAMAALAEKAARPARQAVRTLSRHPSELRCSPLLRAGNILPRPEGAAQLCRVSVAVPQGEGHVGCWPRAPVHRISGQGKRDGLILTVCISPQ